MKLGIPTLCRYDLLKQLIQSVERGSLRPTGYIIVDNGRKLTESEVRSWLGHVTDPSVVDLITPEKNLGVAASWNLILDRAAPGAVIISNDDIVFGKYTFQELFLGLEKSNFVEGDGWALFGQHTDLVKTVGYYDENFWPAYYEDVDYDLRLARAGIVPARPLTEPAKHVGWATTRAQGDASWLLDARARNHAYFLAKWGGESRNPRWNGTPDIVHYKEPFNGKPPPGWSERKPMSESVIAMRWDVLNYIAERIGAKRYLEIGANDGECLKRINVAEKWGVDPNPTADAIKASDVIVPRTSEFFFQQLATHQGAYFDLIFIDADHRAEIVYREIQQALTRLSHRGAICIHDCNPHSEDMQTVPYRSQHLWTGDVWKAVARLRSEGQFHVGTVPTDYGTGILIPATQDRPRPIPLELPCAWDRLLWKDLVADRENLLGLLDLANWRHWVDAICV